MIVYASLYGNTRLPAGPGREAVRKRNYQRGGVRLIEHHDSQLISKPQVSTCAGQRDYIWELSGHARLHHGYECPERHNRP
jgi:hypothetical protein